MKKQQNKQKLDEMEAAMLAALEEMEVKTTGNGLWEQQEDEVSLPLSFPLSVHLHSLSLFFLIIGEAFTINDIVVCIGNRPSSLPVEEILELQRDVA